MYTHNAALEIGGGEVTATSLFGPSGFADFHAAQFGLALF